MENIIDLLNEVETKNKYQTILRGKGKNKHCYLITVIAESWTSGLNINEYYQVYANNKTEAMNLIINDLRLCMKSLYKIIGVNQLY